MTNVEKKVAPINEIFEIAGNSELYEAEKKYLSEKRNYNAIIWQHHVDIN